MTCLAVVGSSGRIEVRVFAASRAPSDLGIATLAGGTPVRITAEVTRRMQVIPLTCVLAPPARRLSRMEVA